MTNGKKSFFNERTEAEIRALRCTKAASARDLVARIGDINPVDEALLLGFGLTPARFGTKDAAKASRKNLRHGKYLILEQPYSNEDALRESRIPLAIREEAFARLARMPEEGNFYLGYSFRPIIGSDKTRIFVPFWAIMDGCRRDTYDLKVCKAMSEKLNVGSKVKPYIDAERVDKEGGSVVVKVPSSTEKGRPYFVRWDHVAVRDNPNKRIICWGTVPNFVSFETEDELQNAEPLHKLHNIRYTPKEGRQGSQFNMVYPQAVEAHQAMIRHFMGEHSLVPLERSQYAIPSKEAADFYTKLRNNVLIEDGRDEKGRTAYRALHIDELSMLMARQVGTLGARTTMYWDAERDGRIRDYNWNIGN